MINNLKKITVKIDIILNFFIVIFFSILIFSCVLQVFTRYVLNSAFTWTEELARYSFIWTNLLGAVLCVKKKSHATVTAITDKLSNKKYIKVQFFVQVVILIVSLILFIYGFEVTLKTVSQTSAAMKISMSLINASVPVSSFFMILYTISNILILKEDKVVQ
ncbi:TRAP transporter small permease [Fusobacterium sp. FSA-380-WT-3A]|uniref:TRAP transporter small permease n=1 Tax=Fusobacterium sp. FSA-380-WT-3A TaxID=2725304 RepID=UPI0014770B3F|nr:TRAP transporter small permease [Fusobacterium sp. FSA-380-WT-3A]NME36851.1 TRAP transporter small permease [Fusobacterium sp. FSA-380-WT-3A]